MKTYSQNNEQQYILEYFKGQEKQINFLEVGAFHPFTFSNTRALVELGASGVYVEPSPECYAEFVKEYVGNNRIKLLNVAVGSEDKNVTFFNSNGDAISSTSIAHKEKWEAGYNVKFEEIQVRMVSMSCLLGTLKGFNLEIDFLNLDVESTNIELFNLIPDWFWERLKMICIEHDNQQDYIINKLNPFGFNELHRNGENLILAK